MPFETNPELASVVFDASRRNKEIIAAIEKKLADSPDNTIEVLRQGLIDIHSMLTVNDSLIRGLFEQNEQFVDEVEKLVRKSQ